MPSFRWWNYALHFTKYAQQNEESAKILKRFFKWIEAQAIICRQTQLVQTEVKEGL